MIYDNINIGDSMNGLKREIVRYIILIVILVIITFGLIIIISMNLLSNERNDIYKTNNLLVNIEPNIKGKIDNISNFNVINNNSNHLVISNNSSNKVSYKILLSPVDDKKDSLKVSLNDTLIRDLSNLKIYEDNYIIFENELDSHYTDIFELKIWLKDDKYKDFKFDYRLKVVED